MHQLWQDPITMINKIVATVELVPQGNLDPEAVVTPGLFVQRIVQVPRVRTTAGGARLQAA